MSDLQASKGQGQTKVKVVEDATFTKVLPKTSPQGQEALKEQLKSLVADFEEWQAAVEDTNNQVGDYSLDDFGSLSSY